MTEEFRQEVAYQGAFGTDGPVLRRVRPADEGTVSFTAILLKDGVANRMNDETLLQQMRDFDVQVKRGARCSNVSRLQLESNFNQVNAR
jgi:hypothetical protein